MEKKKETKKKYVGKITEEDLETYRFGSENQSPNIRALPIKKKLDPKKDFREIPIDAEKASKQVKLNISGIDVYFPYEPYPNQKIYMEKVIQACKNKTIAGLESPTGTGKTLCLLCASLAYLRHERKRIIEERKNNFDVIDNTEKIRQPLIYYTSRTHAQLSNVIQELQKTCYKPRNAIISSRDQMCVNELIKGFHGHTLNMKCQMIQKKRQCRYFKGKTNLNMTWSAYDGKTIDELKEIAKKSKFCPFFFERDKSIHSDLIFLPYNYIFDPGLKKRLKIQMNNAILIIDEAHNIQEICNDAVSKEFNTKTIDEILEDLKKLRIFLENNQVDGAHMDGIMNEKKSKNLDAEPINLEQLKNEINILNNIKNTLMEFQVKSGDNWPNFGLKLKPKEFFDLFYLGSRGKNQKQTTININSINNTKSSSNNNIFKLNNNQKNPPTSNIDKSLNSENQSNKPNEDEDEDDEEELNDSENEYNLEEDKLEIFLAPENISTHINHLINYEFFLQNVMGNRTHLGQYIEVLELIKLLTDNFIEIERSNDTNPLHDYTNNYRFFVEDSTENQNKSLNVKKKKSISNFLKKNNRILHIYCFNPGFGFKNVINEKLHATIITSGTLSPIDGMESELKCSFDIKLEGKHIIDKKQVHFGILTSSISDRKEDFLFCAKNRNNIEMINGLGKTIVELCKITPGGILVFFSSYGIMEDYIKKWEKSKIISEISKYKEFCQDKHDQQLNKKVLDIYQKANSSRENKGAILFSVCRGSCSEGMNFKNDYARLVIVVGIPYANLGDPKTQLRKEYQDEFNKIQFPFIKEKKIKKLSGNEWYNQNAIKCVNQALGRVIRHANDYGCMLLLDSRYQQENNKCMISKWIRDLVLIYNNKNNSNLISNVKKFFNEAEDFTNKKILEKKKLDEIREKNNKENNLKQNNKKKEKKYDARELMNKLEDKRNNIINDNDNDSNLSFKDLLEIEDFRDSIDKKKKRNLPQLNNDEHFNIVNDIRIDEAKNNNNNKKKKNKKPKEQKSIPILNDTTNEKKRKESNEFLDNNFDIVALFGNDININTPLKEKSEAEENKSISESKINIDNKIKNESNKNENEEKFFSNLIDEFNQVGESFFDSLKEEESNKKNKNNSNKSIENSQNKKELSMSQLADEIKKKQNNPEFKEELKKNGLSFTLSDKNENEKSEASYTNILSCPICYENTSNQNIKMKVTECGHFICCNCIQKIGSKKKKTQCPICKKEINLKKAKIIYI